MMGILGETERKSIVNGGETNTVELTLAAPSAVDLVKRHCGMVNAKDWMKQSKKKSGVK
jgi:hypothetical protein